MEVRGWVQVSFVKIIGKLSKKSPILILTFWVSVQCVFCLYMLLSCYSL